jgi:hypothetical protein
MAPELTHPVMHLTEKKRVSQAFGESQCLLGDR